MKFDLAVSEHPYHIVDLAADAVQKGFTTIVVAGGEGSIDETINGIGKGWDEKSPFPVTLGLIPLGTANDLFNNIPHIYLRSIDLRVHYTTEACS